MKKAVCKGLSFVLRITMNFQKKIFSALLSANLFFTACGIKREISTDLQNNQTEIRVSDADANAAEPAIAADSNGNVYVVYVEHYADKSADVFLQKFDADGKKIGEKVRINPEKEKAKAWFGDAPTIKIGNDNSVFVGWTAKVLNAEKSSATVLNLSVSSDGGKTFSAPLKVNDDTAPASHGMHSLEIGKDGQVFMAWLDERNLKAKETAFNQNENQLPNGFQVVKIHHNSNSNQEPKKEVKEETEPNSEVFFAVSNDGGKSFSENKKLSDEVCPCCKTSIATAPDGKIYVSWRQVLPGDFRHIAVAVSENGGANFERPVIVSDDKWQINACPISGAAMSADSSGLLKIIWFTAGKAGEPGLYYSESKDGAKTFSPRKLLNSATVTGTSTILNKTDAEQPQMIFSTADNQIFIGTSENNPIKNAQLPSAAFAKNKLVVAFVRKEGENKQGVWLYRQN